MKENTTLRTLKMRIQLIIIKFFLKNTEGTKTFTEQRILNLGGL